MLSRQVAGVEGSYTTLGRKAQSPPLRSDTRPCNSIVYLAREKLLYNRSTTNWTEEVWARIFERNAPTFGRCDIPSVSSDGAEIGSEMERSNSVWQGCHAASGALTFLCPSAAVRFRGQCRRTNTLDAATASHSLPTSPKIATHNGHAVLELPGGIGGWTPLAHCYGARPPPPTAFEQFEHCGHGCVLCKVHTARPYKTVESNRIGFGRCKWYTRPYTRPYKSIIYL